MPADSPLPPLPFRRYLTWLLGTLVVLGGLLLGMVYRYQEALPPPPFTGSISFDEKAVWLSKRLQEPCDILAVGSSMTVNNLDSEVFASHHFLNASSWGMKIQQTDYFLEHLLAILSPKVVLVVTAPIDFERDYRGRAIYDADKLQRFFRTGDLFRSHLDYLSAKYLLESIGPVHRDRYGRGTYYSLDFDEGGSVPLDLMDEGFERLDDRWFKPIAQEEAVDEANYEALTALATRCRERGILFALIQPPIREDILTEKDRLFLTEKHWPRLASLCAREEALFQNYHGELALTETDFADSTHLNRQGAGKLSRAIGSLLESRLAPLAGKQP